jgi:hypothetical protein
MRGTGSRGNGAKARLTQLASAFAGASLLNHRAALADRSSSLGRSQASSEAMWDHSPNHLIPYP